MSSASPESFVLVLVPGFGIVVRRWPFLQIESPRSLACASSSLSHSSVTLVWVTFRTRSLGASGSFAPYASKMDSCRSQNAAEVAFSAAMLREHEMLTIEPGPTPAGRRSDGNSMRWTDCARRGGRQERDGGRKKESLRQR